jgi:hypothetical protein
LEQKLYLFDAYPVTEDEVQAWLDNIPTLSDATFRREAYRKAYNVEDKIRAAKASGIWPDQQQQKGAR